ncbi:MAG: DUF21 domain-containing protein, partial [Bacteroidales bacterium]|nr:DUF21 domain-containing protein [Bacteroidales bacterium]
MALEDIPVLIILLILILFSALISISENAFFSLSPAHINDLNKVEKKSNKRILKLIGKPEQLLANILVAVTLLILL